MSTSITEDMHERLAKLVGWKTTSQQSHWVDKLELVWYISPEGKHQATPWPDAPTLIRQLEAGMAGEQWNEYVIVAERLSRRHPPEWLPWREVNPSRVIDACLIAMSDETRARAIAEVYAAKYQEK